MNQSVFAVLAMREVSLALSGPVVSALMRRNPPMPRSGISATASAITPNPPNQCVSQRQRLMLRGRASMSESTEAPVVVNPLTLSNTASVNEGKYPLKYNGSAPKTQIATQMPPTVPNACWTSKTRGRPRAWSQNIVATPQPNSIGTRNTGTIAVSSFQIAMPSGSSSDVPTRPRTYVRMRRNENVIPYSLPQKRATSCVSPAGVMSTTCASASNTVLPHGTS